ncbi:MAG: alpha-E domain-containing protein [Hyphomicrobium sp.]
MLCRTANDLYWLSRYLERAENLARLIEVGYRIALLPRQGDGHNEEWRSILQISGNENHYKENNKTYSSKEIIDYLLFDQRNPSSVSSCISKARQNARAQRTALTREMWESLNSAWIKFHSIKSFEITTDRLSSLLDWVKEQSAAYRGALLNTILKNDTFYFSQLGTFLERADNTARILDIKYHVLLPSYEMIGSSVDNLQWASILRSVSAHRSYRWVYKDSYRPWKIADFLILNSEMPRSLLACYNEIDQAIHDLSKAYNEPDIKLQTALETKKLLENSKIESIFQSGLHEFIGNFIARNNRLGNEISATYYFNH